MERSLFKVGYEQQSKRLANLLESSVESDLKKQAMSPVRNSNMFDPLSDLWTPTEQCPVLTNVSIDWKETIEVPRV